MEGEVAELAPPRTDPRSSTDTVRSRTQGPATEVRSVHAKRTDDHGRTSRISRAWARTAIWLRKLGTVRTQAKRQSLIHHILNYDHSP